MKLLLRRTRVLSALYSAIGSRALATKAGCIYESGLRTAESYSAVQECDARNDDQRTYARLINVLKKVLQKNEISETDKTAVFTLLLLVLYVNRHRIQFQNF